ncbi:hypothetical protein AB0M48_21205 [Lentzea sp. NPDC051208]|uniref:hypothetical protein n=1 Tax=Lentzea sp. NPDC051208 TaxID=3154642 RepID=UPI0034188C66
MKRRTLGITTALVAGAAPAATGTLEANAVVRDANGIHHLRFDRTAVNRARAAVNVK